MADPLWLCGLIWAWVMGWAASSYASNFAYRLPRGESPFGREPYCGDCNATLHPRDLFPIFSWAMTGGKCRYCVARVPFLYFLLELIYPFFVAFCYVTYGYGDAFLLMATLGMLVQITAIMAWEDDKLDSLIITIMMMSGLLWQQLQGYLILDGLLHSFFLLMIAISANALITRKRPTPLIMNWPRWIWLFAASGTWITELMMGINTGLIGLLLALILTLTTRHRFQQCLLTSLAPALLVSQILGIVIKL